MTAPLFDLAKLIELGGYKAGCLVAVDPELYTKYMSHLGRFVKHDEVTKNMVFLTALSAYTSDPINLFLRGESSIGKTYNVIQALKYFPKDDVWLLGGLSPTALVHSRGKLVDEHGEEINFNEKPEKPKKTDFADEYGFRHAFTEYKEQKEAWIKRLEKSRYLVDLTQKILVFLEAPHIETFNMLRPILSHDSFQISYKFTDKTAKGKLQTQHVVIHGFPATIFCTTQEKYVKDLATRGFTVTPEMTKEKYKAANLLTATKAAFPWIFDEDPDIEEMCSYIRFLKETLKELKVTVPFSRGLAEKFPSTFSRSMRDFQHVVNLIGISASFHYAQRPAITRKIKDASNEEEKEETYIMAVRDDFTRILNLWNEIRESTETSASGNIIRFFHQVVSELAKEKDEFTVEDLTDRWNSQFEDKKSSGVIRSWIKFLAEVGYVNAKPDPNDKRRNLVSVIKANEKNTDCGIFDFCVIFSLDSFKEWLNEANQIYRRNHILPRENIFAEGNTSIEEMYEKYFRNESDSVRYIDVNGSEASLTEKSTEKTQIQKMPYSVDFPFKVEDVLKLERLTIHIEDKCVSCSFEGRMDWQATFHNGTWGLLCGNCGDKLAKKLREVE